MTTSTPPTILPLPVAGHLREHTERWFRSIPSVLWLPIAILVAGLSTIPLAMIERASRAGYANAALLQWVVLGLGALPLILILTSANSSRGQRIGACIALVVLCYALKILRDPFTFTYFDELNFQRNFEDLLQGSGPLPPVHVNFPVGSYYPGLPTAAAAIFQMFGVGVFPAGVILILVARIVGGLALYLVLERLLGAPRLAGLAFLVYAAGPNFIFWGSQFSYPRLAVPLMLAAMVLALPRPNQQGVSVRLVAAGVVIAGLIPTHHLTAALLGVFLIGAGIAEFRWGSRKLGIPRLVLGTLSLLGAGLWLFLVAKPGLRYMLDIFEPALRSFVSALTGGDARAPLSGSGIRPGSHATVLVLAVVASYGVQILFVGLGLGPAWRARRSEPLMGIATIVAIAFLLALPFHFVSNNTAWDFGNRATDFLALGEAPVAALGLIRAAAWIRGGMARAQPG